MNEESGHKVELYIYDLSAGLCQQLSEIILGELHLFLFIFLVHNMA